MTRLPEAATIQALLPRRLSVTAVDIQTLINDKNLKVTNSADRMVTGYDGPYWAMLWYSSNKNDNQLEISLTDNQGNTLVKGTDYELKYDGIKDISKEGSTASVTITGKGKFYGKQEIKYLLASKLDEDYDVSVNPAENPVYTGDPITLAADEISVSDGGFGLWKSVLEQGTDYTVNYSDGTNADQAINAGGGDGYSRADPAGGSADGKRMLCVQRRRHKTECNLYDSSEGHCNRCFLRGDQESVRRKCSDPYRK